MNLKIIKLDSRRLLSLDFWRSFFMGNVYPIAVCALVFLGNVTALDYYFNFLVTAAAIFALFLTDSVKPIIITVCTYIYQISIPHAPSYPTYSDFFFSGWRAPATVILIVCVGAAFSVFFFKRGIHRKLTPKRTPLLIPLSAFSIALIVNGVFSSDWTLENLIFAILNIIVYFFWFLILYHGLDEKENVEKLAGYFSYVSLLISFVIVLELACLYIWGNVIVDGEITKVSVALGWGIWNLVGGALVSYIPILFYATRYPRLKWISAPLCALAYLSCILTLSRNALLVGTLVLLLCVFIHMRTLVKRRGLVALAIAISFLFLSVAIALAWDKISTLFLDYFNRLLSDNGRFSLWREAISDFSCAPIFGVGFYGYTPDTATFGVLPKMAHNFVLEFLCASGIFAPITFGFWIFESARAIFKVGDSGRLILSLTPLSVLVGSLFDNFVFYIYPMFIYNVILAIITKNAKKEKTL